MEIITNRALKEAYQNAVEKPILTKLSNEEETQFQKDYEQYASQWGISSNPDDPEHFYDYRGLWRKYGGIIPNKEGHLPSEFKLSGHPRMIIGGVNTKTGERVR